MTTILVPKNDEKLFIETSQAIYDIESSGVQLTMHEYWNRVKCLHPSNERFLKNQYQVQNGGRLDEWVNLLESTGRTLVDDMRDSVRIQMCMGWTQSNKLVVGTRDWINRYIEAAEQLGLDHDEQMDSSHPYAELTTSRSDDEMYMIIKLSWSHFT